MPVVTVTVGDHPSVGELLIAVADDIAAALGLEAGGVIATHTPSGRSAISGAGVATATSAWPLVSIHGSSREREKMDAARAAASGVVEAWCARTGAECHGVWTEWVTP